MERSRVAITTSHIQESGKTGSGVRTIVVVGNGPVGMRFVNEALRDDGAHESASLDACSALRFIIYGDESHWPYDRVRLSSWLAGEVAIEDLMIARDFVAAGCVEERLGLKVVRIDRAAKTIIDQQGHEQSYDQLVMATGSSAYVPDIPGVKKSGVFTLRNMDDATSLMARKARSHRCVVIGGGLLGLETARGMQGSGAAVSVVEQANRLLSTQLDEAASEVLFDTLVQMGLQPILGDGIKEILGGERVSGVLLRSGVKLDCDTVVIAAGIRPNIDLAMGARLAFGRGIRVNDAMQTSDPAIYAIGECAEHNGQVYGLVSPGFEQAAVAAASLRGRPMQYRGSVVAARLKVLGTQVLSTGTMGEGAERFVGASYVYQDISEGIYRKLLVRGSRLAGAIGIGDWSESVRLQSMVAQQEIIYPWQLLRFVHTGKIWSGEDAVRVVTWPNSATVCQCTGASRGAISQCIASGAADLKEIGKQCGAGTVCGSCKPLLSQLLGDDAPIERAPLSPALSTFGILGVFLVAIAVLGPVLSYADSVQSPGMAAFLGSVGSSIGHWDQLWRDGFVKQVTGFSILAVFVATLVLSVRKRVSRAQKIGSFDMWRLAHIVLGVLGLVMLVLHTGFRFGHGLNFLLMLFVAGLIAVGSVSSIIIAAHHKLSHANGVRLRRQSVWLHILLFWPIPALLAWHVFKTYWY